MIYLILILVFSLFFLPFAVFLCGVKLGKSMGHESSKAVGWLERDAEAKAQVKSRHAANGQFKAKGKL